MGMASQEGELDRARREFAGLAQLREQMAARYPALGRSSNCRWG